MSPPIFVHIAKTAGSTLRTLITANYPPEQILALNGDPKEVLRAAAAHMGRVESFGLVYGHTPYGTHRFLGIRQPRYFTVLRDPVDRFLSDIAHAVRHDDHTFHGALAEPGLSRDQIIGRALDINYFRNTMVQFVSGAFTTETIAMSHLGAAIDNLWSSDFVGIAEDFSTSLLLMARKLGWRRVVPQKANVRPGAKEPVPPELRARLERALAYDCMLYAVAREHLARSRAAHGMLLQEAAAQLDELIAMQEVEHPDVQFQTYQVGQEHGVRLDRYDAMILKGSPLFRWMQP
ncbi:sulfotransferase family 2 domain-containing protein [Pseudoxanthomonas jiangsuensis]|uniref:sulfotransferase family 2 domain-containing protein n=1 Tax=Pseudoxanthomonas jiangsuensis TaxID=619688 RepID=UPI0013913849|nr:sulfotransferase family 2 domain-containing protein [Pseudoxanthomonas jiangsuensis]